MGDYSDHDPQDEKFPSEVNPQATSSSEVNIEHPGMLYILFHAALMALLACLVAGLGLVGIFFISDFISQSIKLLSNGSRGLDSKGYLSSVELAALVKVRQEELREALLVAKKEKAIAREREIRDEARLLREAAASSLGWSWR